MNELALFAGGGGGVYGSLLLGHTPVCAVEIEPSNRRMLLQRQADGVFPHFPIWDDVRTFDGKPWAGRVDVVSGGFPCQDISIAGTGAGLDGERSGLWHEMARIIGEVRPEYALIENSPMLVSRGLERVLCDLAAMGFDAEWGIVGAHHTGAPHKRERIWILAHNQRNGRERALGFGAHREAWPKETERCNSVANPNGERQQQPRRTDGQIRGWSCNCGKAVCNTSGIGCDSWWNVHHREHDRAIPAPADRWPIGSTAFSPLAMDRFREWWSWHGGRLSAKG